MVFTMTLTVNKIENYQVKRRLLANYSETNNLILFDYEIFNKKLIPFPSEYSQKAFGIYSENESNFLCITFLRNLPS